MSRQTRISAIDRLVASADRALKTLVPHSLRAARPNPADDCADTDTDDRARRHVAGLMRINHTGEVCAQALYQGQALTARLGDIRTAMEHSAAEEIDHLAWCEQRLDELDSHTSRLNPLFYALSFGIGAAAGAAGDRISLGFVAATEEQVCQHLRGHLEQLPADDDKSRAILTQMLSDEAGHASRAHTAGAARFPRPLKGLMTQVSRVMTRTTYWV